MTNLEKLQIEWTAEDKIDKSYRSSVAKAMSMSLVFDNGLNADEHFMLEQDEDGLLYETSNAVTRELVSAAMFSGWGIEQEPQAAHWLNELEKQFGSRVVAERYYAAATDSDK